MLRRLDPEGRTGPHVLMAYRLTTARECTARVASAYRM